VRAIGSAHARWVVFKFHDRWIAEDRVTGSQGKFLSWRQAFDFSFNQEWHKTAAIRKVMEDAR
jgi:hypothetical protein